MSIGLYGFILNQLFNQSNQRDWFRHWMKIVERIITFKYLKILRYFEITLLYPPRIFSFKNISSKQQKLFKTALNINVNITGKKMYRHRDLDRHHSPRRKNTSRLKRQTQKIGCWLTDHWLMRNLFCFRIQTHTLDIASISHAVPPLRRFMNVDIGIVELELANADMGCVMVV